MMTPEQRNRISEILDNGDADANQLGDIVSSLLEDLNEAYETLAKAEKLADTWKALAQDMVDQTRSLSTDLIGDIERLERKIRTDDL